MQKQPLLILLLSFIAGILVQEFLGIPVKFLYIILILCVLAISIFFFRTISFLRFKNLFYIFIAFSLGLILHFFQNQVPKFPNLEKEEVVIFKLQKKLKSNEKNRKYEVLVWKDEQDKIANSIQFKSIIIIPKSEPELSFNYFYQASGFVSRVEPPQNNYQFNYQKYLQRKGIYHQIYLPKGFKQSERKSLSFLEVIKQERLELLQKLDKNAISPDANEFIKGIILADRTEMNGVTVMEFQKTGLVHILAISGTHIAIIFGLFYFVFIKIFPHQWRKYAIISSILFIWIFAIFIGLGNSVVRACIMLTVYFSYIILQRKSDFLHSISLAAILILVFNVNQFFDVGFQLSFSAVLGIFWFNQPILKKFPRTRNKVITLFQNIFSVTTSAQLGTMPLVLFYFHQYSYISILANLIILPAVEILIIGALFITFFISIGLKIDLLFKLYDILVQFVLKVIHWLSSFDFFMVEHIPMTLIEVILLFILLYFLRFIIQKFNLKNSLNFAYVLILFITIRVAFNLYNHSKNEIISHQFYKEKIISAKDRDQIVFYIKENADETKISEYVISPYLNSVRSKKCKIKKIPNRVDSLVIKGVKFDLK